MAVIAGNDNRIAVRVDAGDDRRHDHRSLPRASTAMAPIFGEEMRWPYWAKERAASELVPAYPLLLQHEIHEGRAPQLGAGGRIGAEVFARLAHQRRPAVARLRQRLGDRLAGKPLGAGFTRVPLLSLLMLLNRAAARMTALRAP